MDISSLHFASLPDLLRRHARAAPLRTALIEGARRWDYATLDRHVDHLAAALQCSGVGPGDTVALCAAASLEFVAVFLGALRAGAAVAPLASSVTPAALQGMVRDSGARLLFCDAAAGLVLDGAAAIPTGPDHPALKRIALDGSAAGVALQDWLRGSDSAPRPVAIEPGWPFNIIYSSGTTGAPKGIVQAHAMRWAHVQRGVNYGYSDQTVALLSTPLYSNTTLVVFVPTLAYGGTVVLMARFDAAKYLELAQRHRVTHTMLVPVQYRRLLALPDFDRFDLSSFQVKFATSAPFAGPLKAEVLRRWPGQLIEFYGMTEGGGTCILEAHAHPDKLHTVGRPAPGHDIRLIDDAGHELGAGATGEVVGHSASMMTGYHGQPEKTREAEWFDAVGKRFIRTGDVGHFDADGFLTLLDRKKDLIISGGFNVYPSDLEDVLREHPAVQEVAVVGVPSSRWGETPVAFVVAHAAHAGAHPDRPAAALAQLGSDLLAWANARLGKTQRLHSVELLAELPRSAIGKVLKRELRDRWSAVPPGLRGETT
jgi:long-chain acyl-CoA synthetase